MARKAQSLTMTTTELPRVVFDCNIFVQAFLSEIGPAHECFRLAREAHIALLSSESILEEVQDVLSRPKLVKLAFSITSDRIEQYLEWVRSICVVVTDVNSFYEVERDPKDSKYVDLAITGKCCFLVSRDKDLLDLASDGEFNSLFPSLVVCNPVAFLSMMRNQ